MNILNRFTYHKKRNRTGGCHRFLPMGGFDIPREIRSVGNSGCWNQTVSPHICSYLLPRTYVTADDVGKVGPLEVRPYHLPHRSDFGLRGTPDPVRYSVFFKMLFDLIVVFFESEEVQRHLAQLVMLNGFATDANQPGTEKLCATYMERTWMAEPPAWNIKAKDLNLPAGAMAPQSLFMVKGWNRSIAALSVLYAMWEKPELLQVGVHYFTTPSIQWPLLLPMPGGTWPCERVACPNQAQKEWHVFILIQGHSLWFMWPRYSPRTRRL